MWNALSEFYLSSKESRISGLREEVIYQSNLPLNKSKNNGEIIYDSKEKSSLNPKVPERPLEGFKSESCCLTRKLVSKELLES